MKLESSKLSSKSKCMGNLIAFSVEHTRLHNGSGHTGRTLRRLKAYATESQLNEVRERLAVAEHDLKPERRQKTALRFDESS